jgi:hypothetical protein
MTRRNPLAKARSTSAKVTVCQQRPGARTGPDQRGRADLRTMPGQRAEELEAARALASLSPRCSVGSQWSPNFATGA